MILVTGASGFLGTHLLQALADGPMPVRAVFRSHKPQFQHHNIEWVHCDLLDIYAVEAIFVDITHVYHCAAAVSFEKADYHIVTERNIAITANVVDVANDFNVTKLVHVSSIASLGRAVDGATISEKTEWIDSENNTAYANGKYYAEIEVWRGIAEGLNAVVINPGIILGEGNWDEGSAKLMQTVYQEFPYYTHGVNGFVDVKDVVKAMILLMDSDILEEKFVVVGHNLGYKDLFTLMAKALNKKPPHKEATPFMTGLIWRLYALRKILTGKKSAITKETANTAQVKSYYNTDKILKQLPDFQYTSIENTINRMAKQYKLDIEK